MVNHRSMKQALFTFLIGLTSLVHAQSIDIENIKVNGTIAYSLTLDELKSSNIVIDSIKPVPALMDMSMADSLVYVGQTYFEYYANSGKCFLTVIKFDNKISEVTIGNLTLSMQTTIESIQESFPEYCRATNALKVYQDQNSYKTCGVPLSSNGQLTDSKLLFFFLEGKLNRIDIWEQN